MPKNAAMDIQKLQSYITGGYEICIANKLRYEHDLMLCAKDSDEPGMAKSRLELARAESVMYYIETLRDNFPELRQGE